jgi:hypothetical protein
MLGTVVNVGGTNEAVGARTTTTLVPVAWPDAPLVPVLASGPVVAVKKAGLLTPPPEPEPQPEPGPPPVGLDAVTEGIACAAWPPGSAGYASVPETPELPPAPGVPIQSGVAGLAGLLPVLPEGKLSHKGDASPGRFQPGAGCAGSLAPGARPESASSIAPVPPKPAPGWDIATTSPRPKRHGPDCPGISCPTPLSSRRSSSRSTCSVRATRLWGGFSPRFGIEDSAHRDMRSELEPLNRQGDQDPRRASGRCRHHRSAHAHASVLCK